MNTMRVGVEDGKSLVPVDLAGVGWRRLQCDAIDPAQSQALGRGGGMPSGSPRGQQMTRIDLDWLEAFDEAMLNSSPSTMRMQGWISSCWSATKIWRRGRPRWRMGGGL